MYGRSYVVYKAGQGEFGGPGATAHGILGLENDHGTTVSRQFNGGGQAVGSRPDDYGIVRFAVTSYSHAPIVPARPSQDANKPTFLSLPRLPDMCETNTQGPLSSRANAREHPGSAGVSSSLEAF